MKMRKKTYQKVRKLSVFMALIMAFQLALPSTAHAADNAEVMDSTIGCNAEGLQVSDGDAREFDNIAAVTGLKYTATNGKVTLTWDEVFGVTG